ncbi:MAG: 7TM diverse intracellular signaling domain-containing protein [Flavobacteriales bacterium]
MKKSLKSLIAPAALAVPVFAMIIMAIVWSYSRPDANHDAFKIKGEDILVLTDPTQELDVNYIHQLSDDQFTQLEGEAVPNFGFNRANIWLKFKISGKVHQKGNYILEIKNPVLDNVELYEFGTTEIREVGSTGDLTPFDTREIPHRTYRFSVELTPQSTKEFYLMVNSGGEQLYAPLLLWTPDNMEHADLIDNLLLGTYFGIIVFVLLFNLFIYIILREKSHLYYVQYNFMLLGLQFGLSGYSFQFLWPESTYLANVSNPFFASVAVYSLLKFSQYFLELKSFFPRVNRAFTILGYVILTNALLSLTDTQPILYISIVAVNGLTLLLNFFIIPVAVGVLRKGYKPAKFFLAGFIILVLTVFGFILTNLGVIQNDFYANNGLLIGSASEVILLSFAIVDRFKSFKDEALENLQALNRLQAEQNYLLERKVEERTRELMERQQEILSSIRYAERIQRNILPNDQLMTSLFPESFVYYRPKDIISGDFYWISEQRNSFHHQDLLQFAIGDCTGHGVPGAMMSILGYNLIREAYDNIPKGNTNEILEEMDNLLAQALHSGEYEYASDGMDIVLCHINLVDHTLHMAGANNGVVIWRKGEMIELKGTRRPLGLVDGKHKKPFEETVFQLEKGDIIYSYTDGYIDQFGGPDLKKMKNKGLLEYLKMIGSLPVSEQKGLLHNNFEKWKGGQEQIDDICVMGIKYN